MKSDYFSFNSQTLQRFKFLDEDQSSYISLCKAYHHTHDLVPAKKRQPVKMSDLDHFDFQSLQMDPQSKAITAIKPSRALTAELEALNFIHRAIISIDVPPNAPPARTPPPPVPVNPQRTAHVTKLRETGNDFFKKAKYADAARAYTQGIQLALDRPLWEPVALMREEVSGLLANRAQAFMSMGHWPEGSVDAEASIEARRVGNPKAWRRKGMCLMEMGRLDEALDWVKKGLEAEGEEAELKELLKEIQNRAGAPRN